MFSLGPARKAMQSSAAICNYILNSLGLQIYFEGISINLHFDWITNLTSQLIELHRLGCFPAYVKPRISISNVRKTLTFAACSVSQSVSVSHSVEHIRCVRLRSITVRITHNNLLTIGSTQFQIEKGESSHFAGRCNFGIAMPFKLGKSKAICSLLDITCESK